MRQQQKTNKQKQSELFTEAIVCLFLFLVNCAVVTLFNQPALHTAAPASGYEESKQVHFYMLCGGWIPRIIYAQPENYANWYPHGTVKSKTTQKHKQRKAYPYGVGAFCLYWTIVLGEKNREMCFLTVPHICMCIFLCVCVWVCRWWRRSRVWSEEKNIVWIIHKGQKVTVNESVTGH